MVWTGSMWLRIGTSGGLLWTFGFHEMMEALEQLHNWWLLQKGSAPWVSELHLTIALSLMHTLCCSLQHVVNLLILLCLHESLPADGSQQCPLLPCSHSYQLATVPQLTHSSSCPTYNILAQTAHKASFLCCCIHCCVRICWDAHVIATQPLPSNGRCLLSH
jgi:hypothetical protein